MKRILVPVLDGDDGCPLPDGSTGLTPRVSATLVLTSRRMTPRLDATSSPRQSAALGRCDLTGDDFALDAPHIPMVGALAPQVDDDDSESESSFSSSEGDDGVCLAPLSPKSKAGAAGADDGWSTVPVSKREAPKRSASNRTATPAHGPATTGTSRGANSDDDGDPDDLLHRAYEKGGRNPRGKKSNQFVAVLKREGAVAKRNPQRGGPARR
jgi:hypothetical protein